MKPADAKSSTYTVFNKENNNEDPKFKVGDHVRISKYKNIFAKGYVPNWSKEMFVIKKVKNTNLWTYVISDLNSDSEESILTVKKVLERFMKKNWQIKKSLRLKK